MSSVIVKLMLCVVAKQMQHEFHWTGFPRQLHAVNTSVEAALADKPHSKFVNSNFGKTFLDE